jgi:ATP-binding cassette subfamily B protein
MRGDYFGSEYNKIDYRLIKRLLKFLKPYRNYIIIAIILTLLVSLLGPLRPYFTKIAIDNYIANLDKLGLYKIILIIFGVLLFQGISRFALTYIMQWVGQSVLNDIRIKLYEHLQNLSFRFHDKNPIGRIVTRVTNDVESLNQLFSSGLITMFADILLILWIVGFMFYINTNLTLISLIILPLLLIVTSLFRKKVRVLFRDLRAEISKINSFLNEFISGIQTVKIFNQENKLENEFNKINKKIKDLNINTVFYYSLFYPAVEMISSIAVGLILWYAASNIISGEITVGVLIAFLQYAQMFFRPIRDLSEKYTTLQNAMASSERIFATLDTDDFIKQNDNIQYYELIDSIEFKDLSFSYDNSKWVLKNINLQIKKGEVVAIVGPTGSGKTSIINLLLRFYEYQKGDILIDGISIRNYNESSLRKKISIVQQEIFLFSKTIFENITLGNKDISFEQVEHSAKELGFYDFILTLPEGFNTKMSERGQTLSLGQRQLLSFCRAYVNNPDILILDEATSNIDTHTEILIEDALDKILRGRTSIIIAHRLSTIKSADKIIVIHKGEIREIGTHEQLLKYNGIYSKLYKLQYENLQTNQITN